MTEPAFFESRTKYPCACRSVCAPMILIELRFALTVPSLPRPTNTARITSSGSVVNERSTGRLVPDTSSTMPTVKWFFGSSASSSAKTAAAMAGVNSFDERPYRPPITRGIPPSNRTRPAVSSSTSAVTTSWYSGSPGAPGSFVRSSTAIRRTVDGIAATSASVENGRNSRTFTAPTRSPRAIRASTVSSTAPHPDPMSSTTRSASGCPT